MVTQDDDNQKDADNLDEPQPESDQGGEAAPPEQAPYPSSQDYPVQDPGSAFPQQAPYAPYPQMPGQPQPMPAPEPVQPDSGGMGQDAGSFDYHDEGVKRSGAAGKILVVLAIVLAAVLGGLYYKNEQTRLAEEKMINDAFSLPAKEQPAALRDVLSSVSRDEIKAEAAMELGFLRDAQAVSLLIKALDDGGLTARNAAMSLARIGTNDTKAALDKIYEAMNASTELARAEFAWALCMLGDARGFGPLVEAEARGLTKHIDGYDRESIAKVETTDRLLALVDAKDELLRMYAAMELGHRTDKDVVPVLERLTKDANDHIAREAAISLGRTGDDRAGPVLMDLLSRKPEMLDTILGAIRTSVGFPGLAQIAKTTKDLALKKRIVGMIRQIRDPRAVDFLYETLQSAPKEAEELREQALWALEELGDPRIMSEMVALTQWKKSDDPLKDRRAEKLADGAVEWLGNIRPSGAREELLKLLEFHMQAEPADWTTRPAIIMRSLGMFQDPSLGPMLEKYMFANEKRDFAAGAEAVGRSGYKGALKTFTAIAKRKKGEKFATLMESRDWQMEDRLQDRRNAIFGMGFLGDPKASETLMGIIEDVEDDPELRLEAANALAHCTDDDVVDRILEKVADRDLDTQTRQFYAMGLWHFHNARSTEAMMTLLETSEDAELIPAAAVAVGEAADPAYAERIEKLLASPDEARRRGAMFAMLLGAGSNQGVEPFVANMKDRETALVIRDRFERHPVFVTRDSLESGRLFRRLSGTAAFRGRSVEGEALIWPWKLFVREIKKGYNGPNGLTGLEVIRALYETVKRGDENSRIAAEALAAMDEKGFLLALTAEQGPGGEVARKVWRELSAGAEF